MWATGLCNNSPKITQHFRIGKSTKQLNTKVALAEDTVYTGISMKGWRSCGLISGETTLGEQPRGQGQTLYQFYISIPKYLKLDNL